MLCWLSCALLYCVQFRFHQDYGLPQQASLGANRLPDWVPSLDFSALFVEEADMESDSSLSEDGQEEDSMDPHEDDMQCSDGGDSKESMGIGLGKRAEYI